ADGRRDYCGHRTAGGECEESAGEPALPRPDADGADHTPEFPDRSPQPTEPPSPGVHRLIGQRPEFNHPPRRLGRGPAQTHRRIRRAPPHVDFDTQVTADRDGKRHRPDMVVHLPGGGTIVIDAKTPLSARMNGEGSDASAEGTDSEDHARALLRHVDALASKEYWKSFETSPDFVVCFVPTDGLLSSAAASYPKMIDHALGKNVVLASPATLLVLLKTVALN